MTKTLMVVALATTLASTAFAQTVRHPTRGTSPETRALAKDTVKRSHAPNAAEDVYGRSGQYIGSDPDPQVRTVLQFDAANEGND